MSDYITFQDVFSQSQRMLGYCYHKSLPVMMLAVWSLLSSTGQAQTRLGFAEERLIRQTYLKLTALNEAARRREAGRLGTRPQPGALGFQLDDFRTGPVTEIANQLVADLASLPVGEIVRVVASTIKETTDSDETAAYGARWVPGGYSTSVDPQTVTVAEALQLMGAEYADVGKYTSYRVTVSLDGKERTYRAMVVYHTPAQSSAELRAEFWDAIVGMGGVLTDVMNEKRPPAGSRRNPDPGQLESHGGDKPSGEDKVAPPQGLDVAVAASYCDGVYPICCPPEASGLDQCCWDGGYPWGNPGWMPQCLARTGGPGGGGGGGGGDAPPGDPSQNCAFAFSTGMPVNLASEGNQGHAAGYIPICNWVGPAYVCQFVWAQAGQHSASTNLHGECVVDTKCNKRCNVVIDSHEVSDFGLTSFFFHVTKEKSTDQNDATGHKSASLSCAGGYGYAVDSCLFPFCSISLSVNASISPGGVGIAGGATVQSSAMWSVGHGMTHTCHAQ